MTLGLLCANPCISMDRGGLCARVDKLIDKSSQKPVDTQMQIDVLANGTLKSSSKFAEVIFEVGPHESFANDITFPCKGYLPSNGAWMEASARTCILTSCTADIDCSSSWPGKP